MDKVDLACAETVKSKNNGNDSGFITYSNTIYVADIWLDKSDYFITEWKLVLKKQASSWVKEMDITEKFLMVGEISAKNDNLTVQDKQISPIGNKTRRSIRINRQKKI